MPNTDSHGRPIIVAANWFGKLPAQARRLKPGEQPPNEDAALASDDQQPTDSYTGTREQAGAQRTGARGDGDFTDFGG